MIPTSHFIAIKLKSECFLWLYEELSDYISSKDLSNVIELWLFSTLHITLCYLPAVLDQNMLDYIYTNVGVLESKLMWSVVTFWSMQYFTDENNYPKLIYIQPYGIDGSLLEDIHKKLKKDLHVEDMVDNTYTYIPHITIWRIQDPVWYKDIQMYIEAIIKKHLKILSDVNIYNGVWVYMVDSGVRPELQVEVKIRTVAVCN